MAVNSLSRQSVRKASRTLAGLILIFASCCLRASASEKDCLRSPILFFYSGTLYSARALGRAHSLASHFEAPAALEWSPGCAYYAFVDARSLWIGKRGRPPRRAFVPHYKQSTQPAGRAPYVWNHKGDQIALTVQDAACNQFRPARRGKSRYGDVVIVSASDFSERAVTHDCRSYALGWSSDDSSVVAGRMATKAVQCDPDAVCPQDDLIAFRLATGTPTLLLTAEQQIRYGPVDTFLGWQPKEHLLVTRQVTLLPGGQGLVTARNVKTGRIEWKHECRRAEYLGYGLAGILEGIWNPDAKQVQTRMTALNPDGGTFEQFPLIPQDPTRVPVNWSRDLAHVAWWEGGDSSGLAYGISFASLARRTVWTYLFPHGAWPIGIEWTPRNNLIVATREGSPQEIIIRLLNYRTRKSRLLFEVTPPNIARAKGGDFAKASAVPGAGRLADIPTPILGSWVLWPN